MKYLYLSLLTISLVSCNESQESSSKSDSNELDETAWWELHDIAVEDAYAYCECLENLEANCDELYDAHAASLEKAESTIEQVPVGDEHMVNSMTSACESVFILIEDCDYVHSIIDVYSEFSPAMIEESDLVDAGNEYCDCMGEDEEGCEELMDNMESLYGSAMLGHAMSYETSYGNRATAIRHLEYDLVEYQYCGDE